MINALKCLSCDLPECKALRKILDRVPTKLWAFGKISKKDDIYLNVFFFFSVIRCIECVLKVYECLNFVEGYEIVHT